jgi:hypothetical protein
MRPSGRSSPFIAAAAAALGSALFAGPAIARPRPRAVPVRRITEAPRMTAERIKEIQHAASRERKWAAEAKRRMRSQKLMACVAAGGFGRSPFSRGAFS